MNKVVSLKTSKTTITDEELQDHFDLFYEDLFVELGKYGEIEDMKVCDNVGDHLVGNVYAKYRYEEDACKACDDLNNRFYASCCRQYDMGECTRGGFCNFMHLKRPTESLKRELMLAQRKSLRVKREERRAKRSSRHDRSRSNSTKKRNRSSSERKSKHRSSNSHHRR